MAGAGVSHQTKATTQLGDDVAVCCGVVTEICDLKDCALLSLSANRFEIGGEAW